jgi:mono/diheme cytochrome c family protein
MTNAFPFLFNRPVPRAGAILLAAVVICAAPRARAQEDAAAYFKQNCTSCHTIGGGRLTGPDLKGALGRKERQWLSQFVTDPKAKLDAGDAYAMQLKEEARGAIMPTFPSMSPARAEALLDLIDAESKLAKSQFVGVQLSDRPFTPADVERGHSIFTGMIRLKNGGPACLSCHTVNGLGGLGGGQLGPDLTTVFERYGGRKTLGTWLSAPATPTMGATFSGASLDPDEVLAMTAFFQSTLQRAPEDGSTARLNFLLIGLGGAVLGLALFDAAWHKRFRMVRRLMVRPKARKP